MYVCVHGFAHERVHIYSGVDSTADEVSELVQRVPLARCPRGVVFFMGFVEQT